MNEAIACCPENRTSTREAVVDAMLASGDELAQLQPALNLLSPPLNATPGEACWPAVMRPALTITLTRRHGR